jgi:hypothetical protein
MLSPTKNTASPSPSSSHSRPGAPAARADDEHDERDQHSVSERIGEVRRHRGRRTADAVQDDLEDERRRDRGNGQPADQPVQPEDPPEARKPAPHQEQQADVHERIERQVAGVRERRERHVARVVEEDEEVEVADAPPGGADSEQEPGCALALLRQREADAEEARNEAESSVEPAADGLVGDRTAEMPRRMQREQRQRGRGPVENPACGSIRRERAHPEKDRQTRHEVEGLRGLRLAPCCSQSTRSRSPGSSPASCSGSG